MLCKCSSCGWTGADDEAKPVHDIWSRVAPGEQMPAGDCPICLSLIHPVEGEEAPDAPRMFNAYALDPASAIIRPVKLDERDPIRNIRQQLGCIFIDRVPVDERHDIYICSELQSSGL